VLVDYKSDEQTSHRHVFMAEEGEGNQYANELLKQISEDASAEDKT
jgi:hypothetical protein